MFPVTLLRLMSMTLVSLRKTEPVILVVILKRIKSLQYSSARWHIHIFDYLFESFLFGINSWHNGIISTKLETLVTPVGNKFVVPEGNHPLNTLGSVHKSRDLKISVDLPPVTISWRFLYFFLPTNQNTF